MSNVCLKSEIDRIVNLMATTFVKNQLIAHIDAGKPVPDFNFDQSSKEAMQEIAKFFRAVAVQCDGATTEVTVPPHLRRVQ